MSDIQQPKSGSLESSATASDPHPSPSGKKPRRTWRRFFWVLGITGVIVFFVGGAGLIGADYWTTRPQFCGSCHVMDPYYESWSHDLHGAKIGALCVDCHYAPGERFTLHAKFKGL